MLVNNEFYSVEQIQENQKGLKKQSMSKFLKYDRLKYE